MRAFAFHSPPALNGSDAVHGEALRLPVCLLHSHQRRNHSMVSGIERAVRPRLRVELLARGDLYRPVAVWAEGTVGWPATSPDHARAAAVMSESRCAKS